MDGEPSASAGNAHPVCLELRNRLVLLMATAAHDFREPLGGVKLAASVLASDPLSLTHEETRTMEDTIVAEVDRLTALLEQILDPARLHGPMIGVHSSMPISQIIGGVIDGLNGRDRVIVSVNPEQLLIGTDACLLGRLVYNLVTNAVAVSPRGERVQAAADDGYVRISVIDRGPGIAPVDRERVFRAFERGPEPCGRSGLGLALAARLADALHASIFIADTDRGGATISIDLPA